MQNRIWGIGKWRMSYYDFCVFVRLQFPFWKGISMENGELDHGIERWNEYAIVSIVLRHTNQNIECNTDAIDIGNENFLLWVKQTTIIIRIHIPAIWIYYGMQHIYPMSNCPQLSQHTNIQRMIIESNIIIWKEEWIAARSTTLLKTPTT